MRSPLSATPEAPAAAPTQHAKPDAGPPRQWPNRFAQLGEGFYTRQRAEPVPRPAWGAVSPECAAWMGWPADWWQRPDWNALAVFSGQGDPGLWPGMDPLASVYSGHQFGVWAGQLGDGRALLLGEVDTAAGPLEIQLKGAGRTPYSRMGDGRAVLRSTVREFLCSEAMAGLGIPTTRALGFTVSPLTVRREELETAAIVARVAPSFIRFGHFEHFSHLDNQNQHARLRALLDFVLRHHFPECLDAPQPALALLAEVARRTGRLIAQWQAVGFCHGVMNTDNMSILGLTIDYGPFGFLDAFDPGHVCNHSDHQGRYAYARQPNVAFWNLHALAQALAPLVDGDVEALQAALEPYKAAFGDTLVAALGAKLGLASTQEGDPALADGLLQLMAQDRVDYSLAWRALGRFSTAEEADNSGVRDWFVNRAAFDDWATRYRARLQAEASDDTRRRLNMDRVNPKFVLRNHLAESAIRQAAEGDFSEVDRLRAVLARPFDEQPEAPAVYSALPPDWAQHLEVSCSS